MPVEWQGDHRRLKNEKDRFERQLLESGLDPNDYLVEVRQTGAQGPDGDRYDIYVSDLKHPEHETRKFEAGPGKDWIAEFARVANRRG
jgi:hypothetical protein